MSTRILYRVYGNICAKIDNVHGKYKRGQNLQPKTETSISCYNQISHQIDFVCEQAPDLRKVEIFYTLFSYCHRYFFFTALQGIKRMLTMKQHSSKRSRCLLFYRVVIFTSFVHTRLVSQHVPTWSFSSSPISATNNTTYRISTQMHLSVWTILKIAHILVQCWYVNAFTSMQISVPCKC